MVGGRKAAVPPLTVVLTRPEGRNEGLAGELRARGLAVRVEPLVEIEPLDTGPIDVGGFDWVIVTSATGARLLRERMHGLPRRVAAIGRATADAWGSGVDLVAEVSTQEGLLAELPSSAGRVLFAGAEGARPLLADELDAEVVTLYRSRERRPAAPLEGDLVVLASPSAARSLAELELSIPAVSIGPETTREAEGRGIRVLEEAATPTLEGLTLAVLRAAR